MFDILWTISDKKFKYLQNIPEYQNTRNAFIKDDSKKHWKFIIGNTPE